MIVVAEIGNTNIDTKLKYPYLYQAEVAIIKYLKYQQ